MKKVLAVLACLVTGSGLFVHGLAMAQEVEEVLVQARRVTESLQDVPISMSAVNDETLEALQIDSFEDFKNVVPNLNIQTQFGQPSTPQIYMRGVATGLLSFTVDAGVTSYVDGVYVGRAVGSAFTQPDLEQVEVMRGPQGTLFGRNSIGGAVNFITKAPSEEFAVRADVSAGNFDSRRYRLTLDTGEHNGVAARITYLNNEHDGYVDNSGPVRTWTLPEPFGPIKTASSFGLVDEDSIFAAVRITAIEGVVIDYKFDRNDQTASQLGVQYVGTETGAFGGGLRAGSLANGGTLPESTDRLEALPLSFSTEGKTEVTGHSLTVDIDLSDSISLKSITSYRKMEQFSGGNDIDGGDNFNPFLFSADPYCTICSIAVREQDQVSQELQLTGSTDAFDWIVGAYYFKEEGEVNNPTFATRLFPGFASGPVGPPTLSLFGLPDYFLGELIEMENEARAVFAQVGYAIADRWDLALGVRYTEDDRSVDDLFLAASFKEDYDNTDFDVSVTYAATENINLYGRVASGYLTGGILRGSTFDEETILSYELGLKSTLLDGRARVNAAAYFAERKDVQITFFGTTGLTVTNGPEADQAGVEIEVAYVASDNLSFGLAYGYNNTDFDRAPGDPAFNQAAPENNVVFNVEYEAPAFENGSRLTARLDLGWTDTYTGFNPSLVNAVLENAVKQGGKLDLGARVSLSEIPIGGDAHLRVSIWGKNLTDNHQPEFVRNLFGFAAGNFQIPRTYGVDFSIDI